VRNLASCTPQAACELEASKLFDFLLASANYFQGFCSNNELFDARRHAHRMHAYHWTASLLYHLWLTKACSASGHPASV
jgi:hypothetical protein